MIPMDYARIWYLDGHSEETPLRREGETFFLKNEPDFSQVKHVDFLPDYFSAPAGTDGYYVFPKGAQDAGLCRLTPRRDMELFEEYTPKLPLCGGFLPEFCAALLVLGGRQRFAFVTGVKKGQYYLFPRFRIHGDPPAEPLSVLCHALPLGSDYSDMARWYRTRRLTEDCIPLRERAKVNPYLQYAAQSPEIRIRLGWKPAPPTVLEQTLENEPPMHVACDFAKVGALVEEFRRQGVDKAQFCLVGWNVRGHDGRWPQAFPVEEALGGEDGLRKLIADTQEKGYQIVCHTNSTDCYHISEDFTEEYICKTKDGSWLKSAAWSGGQMYCLCYQRAYEIAHKQLPPVADLGFRGLHYIDGIGILPPRVCYDPRHPVNLPQAEDYANRIARYAAGLFGGFSSEGAYDFMCGTIDYALYISMGNHRSVTPLFDETIPLWELIYHGILLYNPSTETVNFPNKGIDEHLLLLERGGRPSIYYYSKFYNNNHWMGNEDFLCDTPEQMQESVARIKTAYDEYQTLRPLQYEFMERHEILPGNKRRTTYSDGTVITVDYETGTWDIKKGRALEQA